MSDQPVVPSPHHTTPDGGVWQTNLPAPLPGEVDAQRADARRWVLEDEDILGVRGITRVDPPLAEEWVVVTFAVRDRWGDASGDLQALALGGRRWAIEAPDEAVLQAAEQGFTPEAVKPEPEPEPEPVAIVEDAKKPSRSKSANASGGAEDA